MEQKQLLGFVIKELRTLKETGTLDPKAVHKEMFRGGKHDN